MPKSKPTRNEVQTTLRISTDLHYWLRQYALEHRTTFISVVENVLQTWAEEHGFKVPDDLSSPQPKDNLKGAVEERP